jgi:hypothetical protein
LGKARQGVCTRQFITDTLQPLTEVIDTTAEAILSGGTYIECFVAERKRGDKGTKGTGEKKNCSKLRLID